MQTKEFSRRHWLVLLLFGAIGQIAWSVENMYFNLFVFDTIAPDLEAITLMVQLSGVTATVVTLIAGTLSDKAGMRRKFISLGYLIWGITVALFGFISPEIIDQIFNTGATKAIEIALVAVIAGDCVMTLFGSTANDAAFSAWVTDNTTPANRGSIEGVISILPLIAMLIVAGGFGMLVGALGYPILFLLHHQGQPRPCALRQYEGYHLRLQALGNKGKPRILHLSYHYSYIRHRLPGVYALYDNIYEDLSRLLGR